MDDLFRSYDTSIIDNGFVKTGASFEVLDKGSNIGAKGLYRFDENYRLRFYAFLLTDKNDYIFSVEYDSLGNELKRNRTEVVHWYFRRQASDSFRVTFYLFSVNKEYSNIQISNNNHQFLKADLFESPIFSNIIGGTNSYSLKELHSKKIYLKGEKKDLCLNSTVVFYDSIPIPDDFYAIGGLR